MTTIALVGGGVSVSSLLEELAIALPSEDVRLRLVAQDVERTRALAEHGRHLVAGRPRWQVEACGTLADAVTGADVVVLMLRVGGLEARRADEARSRAFGIPGDEGLGPGGAANAMRTLPVIDELAQDLLRLAPRATVLNLVAPLGLTTRVLLDRGVDAVGVCELPLLTERSLSAVLDDVELAYAGFNHLGWFWPVDAPDEPRPDAVELLAPAVAARLVDREVLERYGAAALKYHYWLHDPAAADRLGIGRDPGRTDALIDLRDEARDEIASHPDRRCDAVLARPTPWFRDALVPMLAAWLGGPAWSGYANVANGPLVPDFDPDLVVEVPVRIDDHGIVARPLTATQPPAALAFSRRVERSEVLLHEAWRSGAPTAVEDSFVEGPHHLDRSTARELARAIAEDRDLGPGTVEHEPASTAGPTGAAT